MDDFYFLRKLKLLLELKRFEEVLAITARLSDGNSMFHSLLRPPHHAIIIELERLNFGNALVLVDEQLYKLKENKEKTNYSEKS